MSMLGGPPWFVLAARKSATALLLRVLYWLAMKQYHQRTVRFESQGYLIASGIIQGVRLSRERGMEVSVLTHGDGKLRIVAVHHLTPRDRTCRVYIRNVDH